MHVREFKKWGSKRVVKSCVERQSKRFVRRMCPWSRVKGNNMRTSACFPRYSKIRSGSWYVVTFRLETLSRFRGWSSENILRLSHLEDKSPGWVTSATVWGKSSVQAEEKYHWLSRVQSLLSYPPSPRLYIFFLLSNSHRKLWLQRSNPLIPNNTHWLNQCQILYQGIR